MMRNSLTKKKRYSARFYVKILKNNLPGIWTSDLIFMHNNTSIHNAGLSKLWLEEHDIVLMEWPSYSSDLNPIEHLWFYLKKMIYKVCLDIKQVCGDDKKVWKVLFDALEKVWLRFSEELLSTLIESMELRINAVIDADGWYTQY